ncbi:MAG: hypothetical protein ACRDT8_14255, partial [Micromonosporaceae bacterium]
MPSDQDSTLRPSSSTAPAAIVPVPASAVVNLRGRRAIVGEPGKGWRGDLRTDMPDADGELTHVPVLTELDFYRAEIEELEVFAPLLPIEQVWIEEVYEERPIWPGAVMADQGLVSLQAPPVRQPMPAADMPGLSGRRMVFVEPGVTRRDLRAISEPYRDDRGQPHVNICDELDWYAW